MRYGLLLVLALGGCVGDIARPGAAGSSDGTQAGEPNGTNATNATNGPGGTTGGPASTPTAPGRACTVALAKPRTWRLTHAQLANTLADSLGWTSTTLSSLPAETRLAGYANQSDRLTVAPLLADLYLQVAGELAAHVVTRASDYLTCPLASLGAGTCLTSFLKGFGARMWRRPLTDAEVAKLATLYTTTAATGGGTEAALRNVVQALFMSPNFLYRVELGATQQAGAMTALGDYELASELSYMLWDSAPDATLTDLAAQGKLHDPAVLAAQATRMLATAARAPRAMTSFVQQWLRIEDLAARPKDATVFPLWAPQVPGDLLDETRSLLGSVAFDAGGDRSLPTLLTTGYGFVNARTAPIYGVAKPAGATMVKTAMPATQRRGLLTSAAFLAGHANAADTALVDRGKFIREQVLCSALPPPIAANARFAPQIANATTLTGRERFVMHSVDPACAGCHRLFDGLGFALETYDGIGKYRTTDKGKTIDASGTLPLPSGTDITFTSFVELMDKLASAPDPYGCFAAQYLSYATGRGADQVDDCEKQQVADAFVKSGYKLDALVLAVVRSPSFTTRKN